MKRSKPFLIAGILIFSFINRSIAQNPFILDQFTADPSARVFGDKVYVYPSHDIPVVNGHGRPGWFCMEDYHVFSSADLTHWTDHGVIVSQNKVKWVDSTSYSMWAPDCIFRNKKYYFYFPTKAKDTSYGKGSCVGVAIADKPEGPFTPEPEPIRGVHGIDPNVFVDKDGQAYLYWAQGNIFAAKLKENMLELGSGVSVLGTLPDKGLKEGPYMFERNGVYYLTYPHVENKTERLEYAIGDNPLGPFKVAGVIMDESPTGCWTNHHSIIQFKNQWYLFYHHNDLSPGFDKNRSIRVDSLFFGEDGSIRKVIPTLRGVGLTPASDKIQIDRYTAKSLAGTSITFLDTLNKFQGWKTIFDSQNAWIQYNSIDFGKRKYASVSVRALAPEGGLLYIRLDNAQGAIIATIKIPADNNWSMMKFPVTGLKAGIQNIVISSGDNKRVEVDWISFE